MQENEVGLEQLKSVYKAQTEAYLDFNMALINILTNQKEILARVESLKTLSDDEFKKLSKIRMISIETSYDISRP